MSIVHTPDPPYYAVIFTTERSDKDAEGFAAMAEKMLKLAAVQDGFLGIESVSDGKAGISVSYWRDLEAIRKWKANAEHLVAQKKGQEEWYASFVARVARVERENLRAVQRRV